MKKILGLFKSSTPKVGRKVAKIGLTVAGVGFGMEFVPAEIIEFIPEQHRIYYVVAMRVLEIVGVALAGAGGAQTKTNPDEALGN